MRQFWRVSLYSGLAALAVSAALLSYSEVVREQIREEVSRYDVEDDALARDSASPEARSGVLDRHEAAITPKRRLQGLLEIGGLVVLMAGLVLTVAGATAPGAKRRTSDPRSGREDEVW